MIQLEQHLLNHDSYILYRIIELNIHISNYNAELMQESPYVYRCICSCYDA